MFRPLRISLLWFSMVAEWLRGPRSFIEITAPRANIEAVAASSVDGYTTTIHCQERRYLCKYNRWYVRDRVISTYFVFSTVTGMAPKLHIEACSMERSFPKLLYFWMPSASQKEAAIEAYLDLLIQRLQHANTKAPYRNTTLPPFTE